MKARLHEKLDRLDSRGNQAWSLDAKGNRVEYAYDAQDRLVATVRELRAGGVGGGALLGFVNTTQDWDADGRLVRQTDDSGSSTAYEYDSFGRLARTLFADATNETYEYDARGLPVATTKPDGIVVRQGFDEAGRMVSRTAAGEFQVAQSFEHDGMGRLTRATDGSHVLAFAYDSLGNQVREIQGGLTVARTFDGVGNTLTLTYPNGRTLNRETDLLGRLGEVSDASGLLASFTYQGAGRIASRTAGNGVVTTYTYDAAEQVTDIDHGLLALPFRFEYTYDGNVNRVEELFHHAPEWSKVATYDSLDRLVAFERSNVGNLPSTPNPLDGILPTSLAWTLDGVNEWDAVTALQDENWANQTRSHDDLHAIESITIGGQTTEFSSDVNGNRLADGRFNYTWDGLNQLRRVHDAETGDLLATYYYDALGRRTQKVLADETTLFLYDRMDVIEERGESGVVLRQFAHGDAVDQPIVIDAAGQRLYYLQDALGSVVGLMDDEGTLLEGYLYDAYGQAVVLRPGVGGEVTWTAADIVDGVSALSNPYAFTGQRLDSETSLMYYRARYYDPGTGSFLSRDLIGVWGDPPNLGNAYVYVGNRPLIATDPTGNWYFRVRIPFVSAVFSEQGVQISGGFDLNSGLGWKDILRAPKFAGKVAGFSLSFAPGDQQASAGISCGAYGYPLVGGEFSVSQVSKGNSTGNGEFGVGIGAGVGCDYTTEAVPWPWTSEYRERYW